MPIPNYLLIAVQNPRQSAELYAQLLGCQPVENSETFVLYVLPNGLKLGLWMASTMVPKPALPGGVEIAFGLDSRPSNLRRMDQAWASRCAGTHRHGLRLHICRRGSGWSPFAAVRTRRETKVIWR